MYRRYYLAQRSAKVAREDFSREWAVHAGVSNSLPAQKGRFLRSRQCTRAWEVPSTDGLSEKYDAVAQLWCPTLDAARGLPVDPEAWQLLRNDELRIFTSTVSLMVGEEYVFLDGAVEGACLLLFAKYQTPLAPAEFKTSWEERAGELIRAQALSGSLQRLAITSLFAPRPAGFEFDGVVELWFGDVKTAAKAYADGEVRHILTSTPSVPALHPDTLAIITRVTRSWDSPALSDAQSSAG